MQDVICEPPHDKTNKMTSPVWSESSLCAQWVAKDPSFLHADSEDSDQTGRMPRLIWVFAGRTVILLVLSWGGTYEIGKEDKLHYWPLTVRMVVHHFQVHVTDRHKQIWTRRCSANTINITHKRIGDKTYLKMNGSLGRIWDLIVSVPDHCLSFYFVISWKQSDIEGLRLYEVWTVRECYFEGLSQTRYTHRISTYTGYSD